MKTRIHHIHFSLGIATLLVMSLASRAEDFGKNYGLKFNEGIGFYVTIDGIPNALQWAKDTQKQADESDIIKIPYDVQFYSYGLDFSVGGGLAGPQPPNLLGYGFSYMDTNGQLKGIWPARFVPVAGYEQKVYRIIFGGPYDELRNDKTQYRFWAFDVPSVTTTHSGFLFQFATAKFAEEQKEVRAFLLKTLSNKDRAYTGKLTAQTLVFPTATPFQIHFTSYHEKTGQVDAEVSGFNEKEKMKFTGQLVGIRTLALKQADGDLVWDLQLFELKKLVGSYSKNMVTFEVEIALEDTPSK